MRTHYARYAGYRLHARLALRLHDVLTNIAIECYTWQGRLLRFARCPRMVGPDEDGELHQCDGFAAHPGECRQP